MLILDAINASARLSWAWEVLSSPVALRVEVLAVGAGVLAASLWAAIWANRRAETNIQVAEADFSKTFPGPKPKLPAAIANRKAFFTGIANRIHRQALIALVISFVAGVIVPSSMLYAMTLNYSWFDAEGAHLLNAASHPINSLSLAQAGLFVLDQTLRGGVFDLLEVFALDIVVIDNNPANVRFSTGVFAYHLMVEAFVFSGIWLYVKTVRRLRQLESGVAEILHAAANAGGGAAPPIAAPPAAIAAPANN